MEELGVLGVVTVLAVVVDGLTVLCVVIKRVVVDVVVVVDLVVGAIELVVDGWAFDPPLHGLIGI